MSSMHTPSKNPTSPFANQNNPPSTSASILPHPPSLAFQSPNSHQAPGETSATAQSVFFLTVDAVKTMQLFTNYFEESISEIEQLIEDEEQFFKLPVSQMSSLELETLIIDNPDVLQVIGEAALRSVAEQLIQRRFNEQLTENPDQKQTIRELSALRFEHSNSLRILPVSCPRAPPLRSLSSIYADRLLSLAGLVTRKSEPTPMLQCAAFVCENCGACARINVSRGAARKPANCSACNSPLVRLDSIESEFTGSCILRVQEGASEETPVSVQFIGEEILVEDVKPGDQVEICGILRLRGETLNGIHRTLRSVFKPFVEVLSCQVIKRVNETDLEEIMYRDLQAYTQENEIPQEIRDMAPETDSEMDEKLGMLIKSIAPSIFGSEYDEVKLALLLQAVSGVHKETSGASYRGDIHILLIGDPGQAKSELLKFMTQITPRSIYTSGKGTSSVGLTAMVAKDESGEYYLEHGALVLADQGLCGLDEFDKLSFGVRAVLHECMEQQTVSIAKAGIIAELTARTSILAAANPVDSKYNVRKTVVQNINMEPSLLSRFDLIFLLLDDPSDIQKNQDLAVHLLGLYFSQDEVENDSYYDVNRLRRYIGLVKACKPRISQEASEELVENYLQLRKQSDLRSNRIAALPRQLMSLIRLAEARAKLRFAESVTVRDVNCAFQLLTNALKIAATNENGVLDMRLLMGGEQEVEGADDAIKTVIRNRKSLTMLELNDVLRQQSIAISMNCIDEILQGLVEDQMIRRLKGQIVLIE